MTTELDTLATALYVRTDDLLKESPQIAPLRPAVGIAPQLSDAELVTLAVLQALLGFTSEARWIRHARAHLRHLFPYLPQQPGYNKRLRAARGPDPALHPRPGRQHQPVDRRRLGGGLHPGRVRPLPRDRQALGPGRMGAVRVLRLAIRAGSGGCGCTCSAPCTACPSASPWPGRRPTSARSCWTSSPTATWPQGRPGQVIIGDKGYYGRDFEAALAAAGLTLLRPARKGEPDPAGRQYFKPLRQVIESVNDTLKGQLDLERHGGRTVDGVTVRVLQRILALTAAIWHNDATGQPVMRSLRGLRPLTPWNRSSRRVTRSCAVPWPSGSRRKDSPLPPARQVSWRWRKR